VAPRSFFGKLASGISSSPKSGVLFRRPTHKTEFALTGGCCEKFIKIFAQSGRTVGGVTFMSRNLQFCGYSVDLEAPKRRQLLLLCVCVYVRTPKLNRQIIL
jgi:hypothetical protein